MKHEQKPQPLISVIVPVYNVENYLDRCVNSICNQTYKNLEIILIDDGSQDESGKICDDWAKRDSRIQVYHFENAGLSCARNRGVSVASGAFIGFVDSDDYIDSELYEKLYGALVNIGTQIVMCRFCHVFSDHMDTPKCNGEIKVFQGKDVIKRMLQGSKDGMTFSVWKFLYKREVIEGLMFDEGIYYEDVMFNIRALYNQQRVAMLNEPLYFYVQREDSTTGMELSEKHILDKKKVFSDVLDFMKDKGIIESWLKEVVYNEYIVLYKNSLQKNISEEFRKDIRNRLKALNMKIWDLENRTIKGKIVFIIQKISIRLYMRIFGN